MSELHGSLHTPLLYFVGYNQFSLFVSSQRCIVVPINYMYWAEIGFMRTSIYWLFKICSIAL